MSQETNEWLNSNIMVGFDVSPWWLDGNREDHPNLYSGELDRDEIRRKLLDWEVKESDVFDGDMRKLDGYKMLYASDDRSLLGIHSDSYVVHPYGELLDASELPIESVGLLKQRRVFWVMFGKPDSYTTPEGVEFRPHLLNSTSLDASLSTQVNDSVTLAVCDNTMGIARGEGEHFKIRHTSKSGVNWLHDTKAANAHLAGIADDFQQEVKQLCAQPVNRSQWSKFLDITVPLPDGKHMKGDGKGRAYTLAERKREELTELYRHDPRCELWTNTAFGVVQTMNTWTHHFQKVNSERAERNMLIAAKGKWGDVDTKTLANLELALAA